MSLNKRLDMNSTPARRRRIVADVAKFLLKQYCIKACNNVARMRIEKSAAIIIQSNLRCCVARKLRLQLHNMKIFAASRKLQCCWRRFQAKRVLTHIRESRSKFLANNLALTVQTLCRKIFAKKHVESLRLKRRASLLLEQHNGASTIQRVFRGMTGRLIANKRRQEGKILRQRQLTAILSMQACVRRYIGLQRVAAIKRRIVASGVIARTVSRYWYRRRMQRRRSAIHIQNRFRMLVSKRLLSQLRARAARSEEENANARRMLQEIMKPPPAEEAGPPPLPSPLPSPCPPGPVAPLVVQDQVAVILPAQQVAQLHRSGPAELMTWALDTGLLSYHDQGVIGVGKHSTTVG